MYIGRTRSPVAVILLSIITCGIYSLYWHYVIMDDLNKAANREIINPVLFLILLIVCGPFIYYIWYTVDRNLSDISRAEGTQYKENFILWLILSLMCGIGVYVAMYQLSEAYNELWAKRSGTYGSDPNAF